MTPSEADGNILAVQRGDRDAFAALVARYQNRLYRYLLRWDHEPAAAEDLFQQTWMRVAQYIHRFDPQRNFDPWLFAIARNLAVDHLRRRAPEGFQEPLEDGLRVYDRDPANTPGALEQLLSSERAHWVQKALEAQPPMYREILSLHPARSAADAMHELWHGSPPSVRLLPGLRRVNPPDLSAVFQAAAAGMDELPALRSAHRPSLLKRGCRGLGCRLLAKTRFG